MKLCAGCGLPRQLKPGETHCYPCRKALDEGGEMTMMTGDKREKLIGYLLSC